jgi:hypothetical protein
MTETKHMTLYDLGRIYDDAYENRARLEFPTPEMKRAMHRAGIRAVVEALRDEVVLKIDAHNGCGILATETAIDATRDVFNEILASDGERSEGSE